MILSTTYSKNEIHFLENPDSVLDCCFIKSRIFLNKRRGDSFTVE